MHDAESLSANPRAMSWVSRFGQLATLGGGSVALGKYAVRGGHSVPRGDMRATRARCAYAGQSHCETGGSKTRSARGFVWQGVRTCAMSPTASNS